MSVSVYEALSLVSQFGLWLVAVVTLVIYASKRKQTAPTKGNGLFLPQHLEPTAFPSGDCAGTVGAGTSAVL